MLSIGAGKTLCEILMAADATPLPVVDPRASYVWRYGIRYR